MRSIVWKSIATLASIGAAVAARNAATALWKREVGHEPPLNPADPRTTWQEALGWTVATGALVGVARLLARRGAAKLWEQVEGDLPPALQEAG